MFHIIATNGVCPNDTSQYLITVDDASDAGILFAPGKAANAGGVAISGIEMTQNSMRLTWTREEVENKLEQKK